MGKGGSIIDLVMLLNGLTTVSEALRMLEGTPKNFMPIVRPVSPTPAQSAYSDIHALPLKSKALEQYLISRAISPESAIRGGCVELHYTMYGKRRFAIGFPNRSGGYEIRNQWFKGGTSPKDISLRIYDIHDHVVVFEGFMDFLSYLELYGQENNEVEDCLVLNSVTNIQKARPILEQYPHVSTFFDNDDAVRLATIMVKSWCGDKAFACNDTYKCYKDFNESISTKLMPILLAEVAQAQLAKTKPA